MLIAEALRTLAPFSLVAGRPLFEMVSRSMHPNAARRGRSVRSMPPVQSGAANDGQHAAQVHCFASASSAAQRTDTRQLSLLDSVPIAAPADPLPPEPAQRPIDRIRVPRKPATRRRTPAAAATVAPSVFVPVQRCSAQAANDASIKMYWAKPASLQRERGMRWAMTGTMADIFAELERLERLEHQHG